MDTLGHSRPRLLVAQLGARRHYAVPRAFHTLGLLERLVTDLSADHALSRLLQTLVPRPVRPPALAAIIGRRVEGVPASRIRSLPLFALSPRQRRRHAETQTDYWARRNGAFCRAVLQRGFGAAGTVYAFNGAALEIFEGAKARGLATVLDQTSAPWRWNSALLGEEARRWPGWEDEPGEIDVSGALTRREEREWQLADRIICGSQFVAERLVELGVARERCVVVSYGTDLLKTCRIANDKRVSRTELRVLFVGKLNLGKGVPYLIEAARQIRSARVILRLVGPSRLSRAAMRALGPEVEVVGRVSRGEVARHYAWADVFVLPTLTEGSANVVYEAMAAGLAVVTTPNAGSVVRDGHTGLIVPSRDPHAISAAIERLAGDRELRAELGAQAQAAISTQSLEQYAGRLAAAFDWVPLAGAGSEP